MMDLILIVFALFLICKLWRVLLLLLIVMAFFALVLACSQYQVEVPFLISGGFCVE